MTDRAQKAQSARAAALVPALDPALPYSARLSARSALYTEFHLIMDAHGSTDPARTFRDLVVNENCLSRTSVAARKKLWEELKKRYRLDPTEPLFGAFLEEWPRCASDAERGLTAYVLFALNDPFVAALALEWLYPLLRRAPAELRLPDVLAFIDRARAPHPEVEAWSEQTRRAVCQKYVASIRDFGLARGVQRKTTVRPALYGAPIRLIVRALRLAGVPPLDLVAAPIFRLLALEGPEVIDALGELNRQGALRFRMQGDVVELDVGGGD